MLYFIFICICIHICILLCFYFILLGLRPKPNLGRRPISVVYLEPKQWPSIRPTKIRPAQQLEGLPRARPSQVGQHVVRMAQRSSSPVSSRKANYSFFLLPAHVRGHSVWLPTFPPDTCLAQALPHADLMAFFFPSASKPAHVTSPCPLAWLPHSTPMPFPHAQASFPPAHINQAMQLQH